MNGIMASGIGYSAMTYPEDDRGWYHTNLREGRTALSVLARNDAEREQLADILEEFDPVHMNEATPGGVGGVTSFSPEIQRDADQMRTGPAGDTRADGAGHPRGERGAGG